MPFLFLGLLAYPVAEFFFTGWLIVQFGFFWVSMWLLAAFLIGIVMFQQHRLAAALTLMGDLRQGQLNAGTLFRLFRYYVAAGLLLLPGVLGDLLAVLLLIWPVKSVVPPAVAANSDAIDGEFRRVEPEREKLKP